MSEKKKKATKKAALEQKCDEYLAGWKRALADYENLQQDVARQIATGKNRIRQSLAEDLLPVMDNFEQAINHAPDPGDQKAVENWLAGVAFIKKQFEEVFQNMGLELIRGSGQFNPELHESTGTQTDESKPDQEILTEINPGWKIGETVIRPAKVIINNLEKTEKVKEDK